MIKCESCGADLLEGAKFCSNCGVPVGVKEEFTVRSEDLLRKSRNCFMRATYQGSSLRMRAVRPF